MTVETARAARGRRLGCGLAALLCCAALAAAGGCSGGGTRRPDTAVSPPVVGHPPMAASIDAALAKQAFTPYAQLGSVSGDGLAPNEALSDLAAACMTAAGYNGETAHAPYVGLVLIGDSLTGNTAFGQYGFVGGAAAAHDGFLLRGPLPQGPDNLSGPVKLAADKCGDILDDFRTAALKGSLSLIESLGNDIRNDVHGDPSVGAATRAWAACMATNGYRYDDPGTLLGQSGVLGGAMTRSKDSIALAEADATCTDSTDLDGIYFAVQASYEQQVVDVNKPALDAAARQYRTAYQKEVTKLPALLAAEPATPSPAIMVPN